MTHRRWIFTARSLPEGDGHEELVVCSVPKRIGGRTGTAEKRQGARHRAFMPSSSVVLAPENETDRSGIRAIVIGTVVGSGVVGAAVGGELVGMAVGAKLGSDEIGDEDGATVGISVGLAFFEGDAISGSWERTCWLSCWSGHWSGRSRFRRVGCGSRGRMAVGMVVGLMVGVSVGFAVGLTVGLVLGLLFGTSALHRSGDRSRFCAIVIGCDQSRAIERT